MNLPFTYMAIDETKAAAGVKSRSNLHAMVKRGEFPPPDHLPSGAARWRSDVVARWLTQQAERCEAERDARAKLAAEKAARAVAGRRAAV